MNLLNFTTGNYMVDGFDDRPSKSTLEEKLAILHAKINLITDLIANNESAICGLELAKAERSKADNFLCFLADKLLDFETEVQILQNDLQMGFYRKGF